MPTARWYGCVRVCARARVCVCVCVCVASSLFFYVAQRMLVRVMQSTDLKPHDPSRMDQYVVRKFQ